MSETKELRMTRQRQTVLEELRGVKTHPTADEVYAMVRRRLPKISLGTVYRNLEVLSELRVIQKLEIAGMQRRYDGNPANHAHLRCTNCGRVVDLVSDPGVFFDSEPVHEGFRITGYRLEFIGLCSSCRDLEIGPLGQEGE